MKIVASSDHLTTENLLLLQMEHLQDHDLIGCNRRSVSMQSPLCTRHCAYSLTGVLVIKLSYDARLNVTETVELQIIS